MSVEPLEQRALLSVCTWDGGGADNNWYTPANWVGDARPSAGDDLVFAGETRTSTNNDYTAGTEFASITISDDDFTLDGNSIELSGNVIVASGATGAEIALDIALDDSIDINVADTTLEISGVVSGGYGIDAIGAGTLVLSGSNTYTGNTIVDAGTLRIAATGSIDSDTTVNNGELVLLDGAEIDGDLTVDEYGEATFDGDVTITGDATIGGDVDLVSGTVEIGGTIYMTGGSGFSTTLTTGTVVAHGLYIQRTLILDGGTLDLSGGLIETDYYNGGNGAFESGQVRNIGEMLLIYPGGTIPLTFLKTGTGMLILSGENTYTGDTEVEGGTLRIDSTGSIDSNTTVYDGELELVGNAEIDGNLIVDEDGAVTFNGGTVTGDATIEGDVSLVASTVAHVDGIIYLQGGLSSSTTLSSGQTMICGGLVIQRDVALDGGTLDLSGGALEVDPYTGNGATLSGTLMNVGQIRAYGITPEYPLALYKTGTGTLTLLGTNTYTDGNTIIAGTLRIGDGSTNGTLPGDVTNYGTLEFANGADQTYGGVISGSGDVVKNGAGKLVLTEEIAWSGETTVEQGLLVIGDPELAPYVSMSGNLSTDEGDQYTLELSASVSLTDWEIDWGDGNIESFPGTQASAAYVYADGPETCPIAATATDAEEHHATIMMPPVVVANIAPTLTVVGNQTVVEDCELSLTDIGVFIDPGFGANETFTYTIDWGDLTAPDEDDATIDVAGASGLPTQGSFNGSHTYTTPGNYDVSVTVTDDDGGTSATKTFHVTVTVVTGGSWLFDDSDLAAAVRVALGMTPDAELTTADAAGLTTLYADSNLISDLTGLEEAINLETLVLMPSDYSVTPPGIADLSDLEGLDNLKSLTLQHCGITGSVLTSTLDGLEGLSVLDLRYNSLAAVPSAVAALPSLTTLFVYGNSGITDDPRSGLANLSGTLINVDIAPDNPEIAATINDLEDAIEELAAACYYLPIEMYEYVVNTIEYQPYTGSMKNPLAVLQTAAGNDWDTAWLLEALFTEAGISSNYVFGTITVSAQEAMDYVGVIDATAAVEALEAAGLNPSGTGPITFDHVWLTTEIGETTYALDPSWKFRDFQEGLGNMLADVEFDYDTNGDYLSEVRTEVAAEYYEEQVRAYLAGSGDTIADAAYDGPIHQQVITSLPTALPYTYSITEANADIDDYKHTVQVSVATQCLYPNGSFAYSCGVYAAEAGTVEVPGKGNVVVGYGDTTVIYCNGTFFSSSLVGTPIYVFETNTWSYQTFIVAEYISSDVITVWGNASSYYYTDSLGVDHYKWTPFYISGVSESYTVAEVGLDRLTIGFTGTDTAMQAHLYRSDASGAQIEDSPSYFTVPKELSSGGATWSCPAYIFIQYFQPDCDYDPADPDCGEEGNEGWGVDVYSRNVGGYVAIGIGANQISDAMLVRARETVNDAQVEMANGGSPTDDELIGSFLHLAAMDYFHSYAQDREMIAGLTGAVPVYNHVAYGVTTSDGEIWEDAIDMDQQIPYIPSRMLIDVQSGNWDTVPIDNDHDYDVMRFNLLGYTGSARESALWERLANVPSISAIQSLQYALENSVGVVYIDSLQDLYDNFSGDDVITSALRNYVTEKEDFYQYTENEDNDPLDVTCNAIAYDLTGAETADVYAWKTISGDFEHWTDVNCSSADQNSSIFAWCAYDTDAGNYLAINLYATANNTVQIRIVEYYNSSAVASSWSSALSLNTPHYLKIVRDGTSFTCGIYTDSARTNLSQSIGLTLRGIVDYRVLYAFSNATSSSYPTATMEGTVSNLDLDIDNEVFTVTIPGDYTYQGISGDGNTTYDMIGFIVTDSNGFSIRYGVLSSSGTFWSGGPTDAADGGGGYGVRKPVQHTTVSSNSQFAGDPISIAEGDVTRNATDFDIANLGAPLGISRTYDSANTVSGLDLGAGIPAAWSDRGMGEGWSFTYSDRLIFDGSNVIWFDDNGLLFDFGSSLTTPKTIFGTLTANGNTYTWTDKYGNTKVFEKIYVSGQYIGLLTEIRDRYDCGVLITYNVTYPTRIDKVYRVLAGDTDETCYLTFTYDANGRISTVQQPNGGSTWTYAYDDCVYDSETRYRLASVESPMESVVEYEYYDEGGADPLDGPALAGLLKSAEDDLGNKTEYAYYANRRGFMVTDKEGIANSLSYNLYYLGDAPTTDDNLPIGITTFTYKTGETSSFAYNKDGDLLREIRPDGTMTSYDWNDRLLVEAAGPYGYIDEAGAPHGLYEAYTYDANGNVLTYTDEMSYSTTFTYTNFGNVASITRNADNAVTAFAYDANGCLLSITDPDPDGVGPLQSSVTQFTYNDETYESWGLPDSMIAPKGVETTGDPDDYITTYEYNNAGQIVSQTYRVSATHSITETFGYDDRGNLLTFTDGESVTITYTYDLLDRLTGESCGPLTISYGYDDFGNLTSMTYGGQTTAYGYDKMGRAVMVGYADGTYATYQYGLSGDLTYETDTLGRVVQYVYDYRRPAEALYDIDFQCIAVVYPIILAEGVGGATQTEGGVYITTYNGGGRAVASADPAGNVTTYEYDELGRVTLITSPDPDSVGVGNDAMTVAYTYDDVGNLTHVTESGIVTEYVYDKLGRVIEIIDAEEGHTYYGYDANGNLAWATDARGAAAEDDRHTVRYVYDEADRLIQTIMPDPDDLTDQGGSDGPLDAPIVRYFYDDAGLLRYIVGPQGTDAKEPDYTTEYQYDALGRLIQVIGPDPDGSGGPLSRPVETYVYDAAGNLVAATDMAGSQTLYQYDAVSELIRVLDALGGTTDYGYDAAGNAAYAQDALGGVYWAKYDEMNQLVESIDALGNVTSYTYDLLGNMIAATDPLGATATYEYDNLGRVTKIIGPDPDGDPVTTPNDAPWTVYAYDAVGNLASVTDRLGHTTSYTYDDLGRLLTVTDAEQGVTEYDYDALGNLTSLTDPEGNVTSYVYDNLGRLAEERVTIDSVPYTRYYIYDAAGNLARYIDRNGCVTDYAYDNLGRTVSETWYGSVYDADLGLYASSVISYVYNSAGRLVETTDGNGAYSALQSSVAFEYDALGRVIEETQSIEVLTSSIVLDSQYDARGSRTQLSATIGATTDFVNTYDYDLLGRIERIEQRRHLDSQGQPDGYAVADKRVDLAYNARSQCATISRYADLAGTDLVAAAEYDYDALGRLTSLVYTQPNSSGLPFYGWTYDAANNVTWMETIDGEVDYAQDNTGQLTGADYDYTTDESYVYDDNGNRELANGRNYTTGDHNRLMFDGVYTYQYDAEGNRTLKYVDNGAMPGVLDMTDTDVTTYTWDWRNRLALVDHFATGFDHYVWQPDWNVQYAYDSFNRLVYRTYSDWVSFTGETDCFIYDGLEIALQFHADESCAILDAADLAHRYLWNPQAADQLFADEQIHWDSQSEDFITDELLWALTDHLNSVRDLASYDSGSDDTTIVLHRVFDAFGNVTAEAGAAACLFGYTGKLFDEATGLQNNWKRWYDATIGKFISEDPIGYLAGDPNLYRYVGNNPTSLTDPLGLCEDDSEQPPTLPDLDESAGVLANVGPRIQFPPAPGSLPGDFVPYPGGRPPVRRPSGWPPTSGFYKPGRPFGLPYGWPMTPDDIRKLMEGIMGALEEMGLLKSATPQLMAGLGVYGWENLLTPAFAMPGRGLGTTGGIANLLGSLGSLQIATPQLMAGRFGVFGWENLLRPIWGWPGMGRR